MEWKGAATDATITLIAAARSASYVVLPSEARAMTNPTLIRAIGFVEIARGATAGVRGAWGLITWDDPDDTPMPVGADIPSPWLHPHMSWIAHGYFFFNAVTSSTIMVSGDHTARRPTFDVSSQRKLPDPRGVMMVVTNAPSSAGDLTFQWGVRCLLKE